MFRYMQDVLRPQLFPISACVFHPMFPIRAVQDYNLKYIHVKHTHPDLIRLTNQGK